MSWGNNNVTLLVSLVLPLAGVVYQPMYTVVSLTKNACLSGGNCSYIVRLSVRDLHGPTQCYSTFASQHICFQYQGKYQSVLVILNLITLRKQLIVL